MQAVQGTGLAFIVYTEAIKNMEVSQLWSVLYFFMLLMLGMGSMLGNTAAILTPLTDSKVISSYLPREAISGQDTTQWRQSMGGGKMQDNQWRGFLRSHVFLRQPQKNCRSLAVLQLQYDTQFWELD